MKTVNDILNKALPLYANFLGVDINAGKKSKLYLNESISYDKLERISSSLNFDQSGLTSALLFKCLFSDDVDDISYSAKKMLNMSAEDRDQLLLIQEISSLLNHEIISEAQKIFTNELKSIIDKLIFDKEKREETYSYIDTDELAYPLEATYKSSNVLESYQFYRGESADPLTDTFEINPLIFRFHDINDVIRATYNQKKNGITMSLVETKTGENRDFYAAYFAFSIRNGENIYLVTDAGRLTHPLQDKMRRNPDRDFDERTAKNLFPYQVLFNTESAPAKYKKLLKEQKKTAELTLPSNDIALPIAIFSYLNPEEIVWSILMFDQLRTKYWTNAFQHKQLAITGEMVINQITFGTLNSNSSLIKSNGADAVDLIDSSVLESGGEFEKQLEEKPTAFKHWIAERYAHKVDSSTLNAISLSNKKYLCADDGDITKTNAKERDGRDLGFFRSTMFGTKEDLQKDREYIARYNAALEIKALADAEYKKTRKDVHKWFSDMCNKNKEYIINTMVSLECMLPRPSFYDTDKSIGRSGFNYGFKTVVLENVAGSKGVYAPAGHKHYDEYFERNPIFFFGNKIPKGKSKWKWREKKWKPDDYFGCVCCKDKISTVQTSIDLRSGITLKEFFKIDTLPWQLEHYTAHALSEPYDGNCILDRLDPFDWVIENPWREEEFKIFGYFCKKCFDKKREELGLKKIAGKDMIKG